VSGVAPVRLLEDMTAEEILPIEVPFDRTTPSIVLPEHAASMTRDALSAAPDPTITLATLKAVSVSYPGGYRLDRESIRVTCCNGCTTSSE